MNLSTGRIIGTTLTEPSSNEISAARNLLIKPGLMANALHYGV